MGEEEVVYGRTSDSIERTGVRITAMLLCDKSVHSALPKLIQLYKRLPGLDRGEIMCTNKSFSGRNCSVADCFHDCLH